ncbi:D-alanyl-D-alanine carboxypeptidase/D-alanyl-D-alanine-endopeptidase [Aeromicrobium sp. PE09-221]|uniref:D-alanyl-D-alanine carboxypeptidase/D-alanyl-D-alanine endopeptidase n=1 Tax=Aeromicrobium sp. PE09-221 TaxID=1898043 RepID=UPI000B3E7CFB|nr:D-alanyl-D-alanine carboxypeptidase/D-alanyl-D-alanine-endopeptidase [Aeromicrobium sp. PE09-221]OUZ07492.1 D-alanyl-D-alanine carboxypeptidase/D-alanyl-D-alanine-endopeptidase [Aeromicrobium sp. PE09-221]
MAVRGWGRVLSRFLVLGVVLAVLAGIGILYLRGDLNRFICDGACPARYATAPEGVQSLAGSRIMPDEPTDEPIASNALKQAVAGPLSAGSLGPHVGFAAVDARDGTPLAGGDEAAFVPASTTKVLTAYGALKTLGPDDRFSTRVVRDGTTLTLIGGGDPYLSRDRPAESDPVRPASLETLADRVVREVGAGEFALQYDASLFSGPAISPDWEEGYVPGVVAPIVSLWADQGRRDGIRSLDPALAAANDFATLLRDRGVTVSTVAPGEARANASDVALVRSAPVATIAAEFLATSDNEATEVMLRHIAVARGEESSFAGGVSVLRSVLEESAISTDGLELYDGSGLSRGNRISPTTLVQTLVAAGRDRATTATLSGLPVGGFDGTVRNRFAQSRDALGWVRAKTGTLTGVHSLAGIATIDGGRPIAFAVMADDTEALNPLETQAALDAVAGAVAGCAC